MQTFLTQQPISATSPSNTFLSPLSLLPNRTSLSLSLPKNSTLIRMGGGPRTFPGGVSKWEWKRMQAKKSKQLLKARLARERQIYEMRKRAELKAAVSDLERPWEVIRKAAPNCSTLFSVSADEQLKVLADRFQKPGGYDLWTENDGPQIFVTPEEELPTARFFPKGVVHSTRPYGRIDQGDVRSSSKSENSDSQRLVSETQSGVKASRNGNRRRIGSRVDNNRKFSESDRKESETLSSKLSNASEKSNDRNWGNNRTGGVPSLGINIERIGSRGENCRKPMSTKQREQGLEGTNVDSKLTRDGSRWTSRRRNSGRVKHLPDEDVYDLSLQGDGSYGFRANDGGGRFSS